MEIQDYIKVLSKNIILVLVTIIVLVGLATYDYKKNPISHSGSITFTAGNKSTANKDDTYDRYYNLAATGILTDTISGWMASPNIVALIYQKAGLGVPGGRITSLSQILKSTKTTPESSVVVVSYNNTNRDSVEKILSATASIVNEQVLTMQSTGSLPSELTITASTPTVIPAEKNLTSNIVISIIAGLILGSVLAFIREAFKRV